MSARMSTGGDVVCIVLGWFTSIMGRALVFVALTLPMLVVIRSCGGFTLPALGLGCPIWLVGIEE